MQCNGHVAVAGGVAVALCGLELGEWNGIGEFCGSIEWEPCAAFGNFTYNSCGIVGLRCTDVDLFAIMIGSNHNNGYRVLYAHFGKKGGFEDAHNNGLLGKRLKYMYFALI
jgi:hypothetical protein